mmetsp:Transcript_828/g.2295  ORF Transcript_828/g.2295 Transcript_828/m.2295 type:complete len:84 (+) Transcript_828:2254-2505(+)
MIAAGNCLKIAMILWFEKRYDRTRRKEGRQQTSNENMLRSPPPQKLALYLSEVRMELVSLPCSDSYESGMHNEGEDHRYDQST